MDTLIVFLMLIPIYDSVNQTHTVEQNRFIELFDNADKKFNKQYQFNIDSLKKASYEAVISAHNKTKDKLKKIYRYEIHK